MLYKSVLSTNKSALRTYFNICKREINFFTSANSRSNASQHLVTVKAQIASPGSCPTHRIGYRRFHIKTCQLAQNGDNDKVKRQNQHGINFTFLYCFKFTYAYLRDRSVVYHVGRSFLEGTKAAFSYISECLAEDNFENLTEVVTPELLERIKKDEGIRSPKSLKPDIYVAKDLKFVSFANMDWSVNSATKVKTIEVLVRFAFFREAVGLPTKLADYKEAISSGSMKGVPMNFAQLRFVRTYGEDIKDSPWIVKNLYYFTAVEKFITPSK